MLYFWMEKRSDALSLNKFINYNWTLESDLTIKSEMGNLVEQKNIEIIHI